MSGHTVCNYYVIRSYLTNCSEDRGEAPAARRERLAGAEERVAVDRAAAPERQAVLRRLAHRRQAHPHRRALRRTVSDARSLLELKI